jgi:hypothetical protein
MWGVPSFHFPIANNGLLIMRQEGVRILKRKALAIKAGKGGSVGESSVLGDTGGTAAMASTRTVGT